MSVQDEYRRHAEHALEQADMADDEDDRATWMWVAKGWLGLLPARPVIATAALDAIERERPDVMPDLRGLSARDALRALTRLGMSARMSGDGFVVEQSPEAGSPLVAGDAARLKLGRRPPAPSSGGPTQ